MSSTSGIWIISEATCSRTLVARSRSLLSVTAANPLRPQISWFPTSEITTGYFLRMGFRVRASRPRLPLSDWQPWSRISRRMTAIWKW